MRNWGRLLCLIKDVRPVRCCYWPRVYAESVCLSPCVLALITGFSSLFSQSLLCQIFPLALRELMTLTAIANFELLVVMALSWIVGALLVRSWRFHRGCWCPSTCQCLVLRCGLSSDRDSTTPHIERTHVALTEGWACRFVKNWRFTWGRLDGSLLWWLLVVRLLLWQSPDRSVFDWARWFRGGEIVVEDDIVIVLLHEAGQTKMLSKEANQLVTGSVIGYQSWLWLHLG